MQPPKAKKYLLTDPPISSAKQSLFVYFIEKDWKNLSNLKHFIPHIYSAQACAWLCVMIYTAHDNQQHNNLL